MKCPNCGASLNEDAVFCSNCGKKIDAAGAAYGSAQGAVGSQRGNGVGYQPGTSQGGGSSYQPGGNSGIYQGQTETDREIRKYFLASKRKWPIWFIIVGILIFYIVSNTTLRFYFPALRIIGIALFVFGLVALLLPLFTGSDHWVEQRIDGITEELISSLSKRGLDKLNLIAEQVSIINPVILHGHGIAPDSTFAAARDEASTKKGFFSRKKWIGTRADPEEAYRIGSDDRIRSLLLEVSVYYFTDHEALMYSGDVDISTRLIYNERTAECFYSEIESMDFAQNLYKVFSAREKKYVNRVREYFVLYSGGSSFSASYCADVGDSALEEQFTGMRHLIRDRKNG